MNKKSNQVLIGVILILIALFSILKTYISLDYSAITLLVMGMAFLLLYRTKRKSWSLILGGYMIYFGSAQLFLSQVPNSILAGMFFIVPGAFFLVLYYDKNKRGLLVPACILIWIGVAFIFVSSIALSFFAELGIFIICFGFSLFSIYFLGRYHVTKFLLYFGGFFVLIGALFTRNIAKNFFLEIGDLPSILTYIVLGVGIIIIVNAIRKKN